MKVLVPQQLPMPNVSNSFFPFNPSLEEELKRLFADFTISPDVFTQRNDVMEEFKHNGHDSEYCPELESGAVPTPNPRRRKNKKPLPTECVFCKNNGEEAHYYRGHLLKDADGRVNCPILRAYTCPICGACGDIAHTIKYCPLNKNPEAVATVNALKVLRNSTGKRRSK
ncbi:protein nanos [Neodiprion pinetum]|uniref:Nanos homolog 1 n=1 Tax=Neodiprion lecontei TaxID=441921 RepID=A0A6J0C3T0_NEOLC|nr:nanos homolog 1 [Neodiprion lecontei]XP_046431465.1 nanos homolog 1 [Neodiprion fabricii]XP_046487000.1 nanos homolog 1 [Neodiprion pinetum]XP_046625138.1 nanos homolog 1 [Neodiprion virginianus]